MNSDGKIKDIDKLKDVIFRGVCASTLKNAVLHFHYTIDDRCIMVYHYPLVHTLSALNKLREGTFCAEHAHVATIIIFGWVALMQISL